MSERLASIADGRRRAGGIAGMRARARGPQVSPAPPLSPSESGPDEPCDLCGGELPSEHRHMLELEQRSILCVCESCWALRAGEPQLAPVGHRTLWLENFELPDETWASFGIPIGLAFFLHSSVTSCVVALYPSPAGATESELRFADWQDLVARNPVLAQLEPDAEALVVDRMSERHGHAIVPIDRAYALVGLVKASWEGISGGAAVERAVARYFDELRASGVAA